MPALSLLPVLGAAVSVASGFAALGVALYPQAQVWSAASLYGGFGLAAGAVCGVIDLAWRRLPSASAGQAQAASAWADPVASAKAGRRSGASGAAQPSRFGA